jgi:hypothetical protein
LSHVSGPVFKLGNDECLTEVCVYSIILAVEVNDAKGLRQPFMFRTYPCKDVDSKARRIRNPGTDAKDIKIKDVLNATSAAPGFFKAAVIDGVKYRDGTVWIANPAYEIVKEIEEMHDEFTNPIRLMVSVGSGIKKRPLFRSSRYSWDELMVNHQVNFKLKTSYQRFDGPTDLFDLEVNEWISDGVGETTFNRIKASTKKFCESRSADITRCAEQLVECRRARARTARWEKFALGIEYVCREPECRQLPHFETRASLIYHLMRRHNMSPPDSQNWETIQEILLASQTSVIE